jgi:hypothetical protein
MHAVLEIRRIAGPVFALALLMGTSGGMALDAPMGDGDAAEILLDNADTRAYRDVVVDIEREFGAYAPDLPEKLLSLGLALQRQSKHAEAVRVFKRGTHLARINDGLYSAAQIPLIQGEITSHIAVGELQEADERQQYMYRVQQRSLNNPESRTQALMQQAHWQHSAYQLGIGEQRYSRLTNMWDLYRGALTNISDREGETSSSLLLPLRGLLQTQYLISGHDPSSNSSASGSSFSAQQDLNRFNAYRARSYRQGHAVIRAIYDIENAQTDEQFLASAEALVMLGDWNLWHGEREPAEEAYRAAIMELVELDDAELQIARLFGEPQALPAIDTVRPLPPVVAADEGDILVEFTVTERGRVTQLNRLDENTEYSGRANRLMRKLRATTFRPRFVDMNPASTEKIVHAYRLSN